MASQFCNQRSSVQCWASSEELRRHTEQTIYSHVESRSSSPCEGCSSAVIWISSNSSSCYVVEDTSSSDSTEEIQSLRGSRKRKSTGTHTKEGPQKRARGSIPSTVDNSSTASSSCEYVGMCRSLPSTTAISISSEAEGSKRKRKSEETEVPRKRRKSNNPSEGLNQHDTSSEHPGTSSVDNTPHSNSRDIFLSKYKWTKLLGKGAFGSVFAGYRKIDNVPVAIKCIPQCHVRRIPTLLDGKMSQVPLEVALLLKVKPASGETSAAVALLDWYDLKKELILVLERPVPCCDLFQYIASRMSPLPEHKAKAIANQLLDALIDIHSKGVFHRDIKADNILIETGSDVPRVRLIDFGCGTFVSERSTAEAATVQQFGAVLCWLLDADVPLKKNTDIFSQNLELKESLSLDGQSFLRSCLSQTLPTLEALKEHPWLKSS